MQRTKQRERGTPRNWWPSDQVSRVHHASFLNPRPCRHVLVHSRRQQRGCLLCFSSQATGAFSFSAEPLFASNRKLQSSSAARTGGATSPVSVAWNPAKHPEARPFAIRWQIVGPACGTGLVSSLSTHSEWSCLTAYQQHSIRLRSLPFHYYRTAVQE
jgi:hypothetical protein